MSKLYELSHDIRALLDSSDDGELTPEQLERFDALGLALDAKIDGCCGLIREWESIIAARQAEIDRLKMGIQTRENNIRRMKEYLRDALLTVNQKKHETPLFTIWRQNSPPAITCEVDVGKLTPDFTRVTVVPDNKKALEQWKATGYAPFGFDVTQSEHLRIK